MPHERPSWPWRPYGGHAPGVTRAVDACSTIFSEYSGVLNYQTSSLRVGSIQFRGPEPKAFCKNWIHHTPQLRENRRLAYMYLAPRYFCDRQNVTGSAKTDRVLQLAINNYLYPPNHQNTPTVPGRVPTTPAGPNYRTQLPHTQRRGRTHHTHTRVASHYHGAITE